MLLEISVKVYYLVDNVDKNIDFVLRSGRDVYCCGSVAGSRLR